MRKPIAKAKNRFTAEVREVPFERAAQVVSVPHDDPIWSSKRVPGAKFLAAFKGGFVRLQPPAEATDEHVAVIAKVLRDAGATVRVLPKLKAAVLPAAEEAKPQAHKRVREVVLEMVDEANTRDRKSLRAAAEQVMAECGL